MHKNSALAQTRSKPGLRLKLHSNKISELAIGMESAEGTIRSERSVTETTIKAPQSDQWSTRVPVCIQ